MQPAREGGADIKVSVIIPVHNVETAFLDACMESVKDQTEGRIEIFVIDDGSESACAAACDRYAADSRVQVFHQQNQGVSVCRNRGLDMARGEWVAFVDSDDWLEPSYLEQMLDCGVREQADIVITDCFVNYKNRQLDNSFFNVPFLSSETVGNDRFILQFLCRHIYGDGAGNTDCGSPWGKLYRRRMLQEHGLRFDPALRRMQDNVFNLAAFQRAGRIVYLQQRLYHYRKSTSSGFSRYNPHIVENYINVFDAISAFIHTEHKPEQYMDALNYKVLMSLYPMMKMDFFNTGNPKPYRQRKRELLQLLHSPYYERALRQADSSMLSLLERVLYVLEKNDQVDLLWLAMKCKDILFKLLGRGL